MNAEEHIIASTSGEYSRKAWFFGDAPGAPQKLCVFLDAEYYLQKMDVLPALLNLRAKGAIPASAYLFVSHVNGEARHADYTCNPRYADFIARDVVQWARARNPGISEYGNAICGLSLSGLASAHLALTRPDLFPYALSQSGSFWWNEEWLRGHTRSLSAQSSKLWLSVGDQELAAGLSHPPTGMRQEVSQVEATENLAVELKLRGHEINFHLFAGGHEVELWRDELPSALEWLMGKRDS